MQGKILLFVLLMFLMEILTTMSLQYALQQVEAVLKQGQFIPAAEQNYASLPQLFQMEPKLPANLIQAGRAAQ